MGTVTINEITLSQEQQQVHDAVLEFVKEKKLELKIGGYAGVGKTTLVAKTVSTLREQNPNITIAFCCYTGKAAYVLREKLTAAGALNGEYVGTIHGLIYKPVVKDGVIIEWRREPSLNADLVIVDEASMVNETIWADLQSYKKPIIAVGDHGQLPPVNSTFNLMEKPDLTLTQIQRQAADNPIIQLSIMARKDGKITEGSWGDRSKQVVQRVRIGYWDAIRGVKDVEGTLFICGWNRTRTWVNKSIRQKLKFKSKDPMPKERVICLKNNREIGIFNGMGGEIVSIIEDKHDERYWYATCLMDDETRFVGRLVKAQFGAPKTLQPDDPAVEGMEPRMMRELFDWGYCLTVHKCQGSEADSVLLFDERFPNQTDEEYAKWIYTGVTRARKNLTIVERK